MTTCNAEVWILVDSCGDYAVGKDEAAAREAYANDIGALEDCDGFRMVKVVVAVPLPEVVELTGAVSELGEPSGLTASAAAT